MKNKLKSKWQIALEIISIPFALTIYIVDRFAMSFMLWKSVTSIQKWMYDDQAILKSTFRVILYLALYGFIQFMYWL